MATRRRRSRSLKDLPDRAKEGFIRGFHATGLGFAILLSLISFTFLVIPYIGAWAFMILVIAIPVVLLGTFGLIRSSYTRHEIMRFRMGVAVVALGIGLAALVFAIKQVSWLWIIVDVISIALTVRFIAQRSNQLHALARTST